MQEQAWVTGQPCVVQMAGFLQRKGLGPHGGGGACHQRPLGIGHGTHSLSPQGPCWPVPQRLQSPRPQLYVCRPKEAQGLFIAHGHLPDGRRQWPAGLMVKKNDRKLRAWQGGGGISLLPLSRDPSAGKMPLWQHETHPELQGAFNDGLSVPSSLLPVAKMTRICCWLLICGRHWQP